ncbi:MAG: tRNA pseudouridine(38-40) synthase TruA [Gammaproteobacteria bacterium]|nr:tRNA pseudouridine(38-40) synthase TruA [Gammaproteobacteria bacterium]
MKLAFIAEYDGSGYCGWQRQGNARTVQREIENALSFVADQPLKVVAAGRTDAGVHASAQVLHTETSARRANHAWLFGANSRLPGDISLRWCQPVEDDFSARFSAQSRSYRYIILNRPLRSGLLRNRCAWECRSIDAACMHEAAQALIGEHDFAAFRAASCQATTSVRQVREIAVQRHDDLVVLAITANGFLHNMVRIIAGSLLCIGRGERPTAWLGELLRGQDRRASGATAPAQGLYLTGVSYPARYAIPRLDRVGRILII